MVTLERLRCRTGYSHNVGPHGATTMTLDERVARLEAQREAEMKDAAELKSKLCEVDTKVDEINGKLDRQKGFIAGAMTILTFFWGLVGVAAVTAWDYVTNRGGELP